MRGGTQYVTVAQRIQEGHHAEHAPRFSVVRSEPLNLGEVHLWQVEIDVQGQKFVGTASINFGGRGADQTNPVENAETSALGRALGFAGFGSIDSVASAEEVREAKARQAAGFVQPAPKQSRPPQLAPAVQGQPASSTQKKEIKRLLKLLDYSKASMAQYFNNLNVNWESMSDAEAAGVISDLECECQENGVAA